MRRTLRQVGGEGVLSTAVQNAAYLAAWDEYVREFVRATGNDLPPDLDERFDAAWFARRSQPAPRTVSATEFDRVVTSAWSWGLGSATEVMVAHTLAALGITVEAPRDEPR